MSKASLNGLVISIFIDNIKIIALKRSGHISQVKVKLAAAFSIIDIRLISFYLKLKI